MEKMSDEQPGVLTSVLFRSLQRLIPSTEEPSESVRVVDVYLA